MLYIGQKLRSKREECRWKQETVAKAMNIPQTTLSRIENNQLGVSEENILKFAEVLGITVEELQESAKIRVNRHSKFTGNGYTNAEVFQQALSQLQETSQQMKAMIEELKADKAFLKEENHQLRQRDEKWMQMLLDMQRQLAAFLGQNKS